MTFEEWLNEEEKKKKKKYYYAEQQGTSPSFSEWLNAEYGIVDDNVYEDIAPVGTGKTTSKKADLFGMDFVQEGTLSDGYQFGDVTGGILGTAGDLGLEVVKGAGGLVEGVTDLLLYGASGIADLFGAKGAAKDIKKAAKADTIGALTNGADDFLEKYSFSGDTLDAVGQGVGQVGTLIATGGLASSGLGATALTTGLMGASGFGSGMSEAYNSGATDSEAITYGLISAAADAGTELIFGGMGKSINALGFGKGLLSADDILAKTVSNRFKTTLGKNLAEFGIKAGAEGLEEVLAGGLQAIGKKVTYMKEEDFDKILADENLFEQFVVGAFTSGIAQAGDVRNATKSGRDYITGLTQNEQSVVDRVYENTIQEQGITDKKEKQKIYDKILSKLDKGYISTDDIESALGGETYKAYKETTDNETALADKLKSSQKEYNDLKDIHWRNRTEEQFDRMAELETEIQSLEAQVKESTVNSKRGELKSQLSKEVFELTKNDTKLQESYREIMRRGQALELNVEQYKGAAKITAQNLLNGGMNNTNRVHDAVDFLTKLSADKNIVFDVATAKKLAEAGLGVDGRVVNGVNTKDGIILNLESTKYLNSTVGHEITHALEGTEHYEVLKNAIKEYAELKGEYQNKYSSLERIYAKKDANGNILKDANGNIVWIRDDVDIDSEVVADLVGDYLFTDEDFVNNLSVKHRNVFQKIYDEIKYLVKIATAGSEEARKLEEVKRAFDKAYRENKANPVADTKHSLGETTDGRFVAVVDNDILSKVDLSKWDKETKKAVKKAANEELKKFSSGFVINGVEYVGNKDSRDEYIRSDYSETLARKNPTAYLDKMRATSVLDDVVRVATGWTNDGKLKYDREDYVDFVRGKALIMSGGRGYKAVVLAGITEDGKAIFHDVEDIYPDSFEMKKSESSTAVLTSESSNAILEDSDAHKIAQVPKNVKGKFSLSEAVEETKDLVALHNLTADKLTKSLELGGLPMPSLAVTKSDIPHDNFGDITLIFGKETIDPKASKKNKVYSADAWTPIFPNVEYEADSKVVSRVEQKLRELSGTIDDEFQRDLSRIFHSTEDYLNRQGGEEGLIQYVMDNYGLKAAYLEDIGKHIEKVTKQEEVPRKFNLAISDKYEKVMEILGVNTAEEVWAFDLKEARDNHGAELEEVFPGITQSGLRMGKVLGSVAAYINGKDSPIEYKTVTDTGAMKEAVDAAIDAEGFEAWVRNLFSGVVKDSGIYNNKDLFTPSGNRRSFKQTHLPVTLENIVKAMASQNDGNAKNVSGFNGVKTLRAATAETFKSIDEMHQRKGRLQHLTQEQADEITEALQNRLFKVMEAVDNENSQRGDRNIYIRLDQIGETIAEIGEGGKYDIADIQSLFNEYGRTVSDETAQDIKQLLYDVTQMPVNIFEAKPQRVVSFDEAKVFVIPYNADAKLKQELLGRGYSIAEYDPNVEGDRNRVVNQYEEYKFSLSDPNDIAPVDFQKSARYLMLDKSIAQEDIAPVRDEASALRDELTALEERLNEMAIAGDFGDAFNQLSAEWSALKERVDNLQSADADEQIADASEDVPLETADNIPLTKKLIADIARDVRTRLGQPLRTLSGIRKLIEDYSNSETPSLENLFSELKANYGTYAESYGDEALAEAQKYLRTYGLQVGDYIKKEIADYESVRKRNRYKIKFSDTGTPVDMLYYELNEQYPHLFPARIDVPTDQFDRIVEVANMEAGTAETQNLPDEAIWEAANSIAQSINSYKYAQREKEANKFAKESFDSLLDAEKPPKMPTRSELHKQKIDEIKSVFNANGLDFDEVLKTAKNLSTFATVDNTPQRVMEKALGYKEGQILSDLTVNKVAQNETEGIKWLNSVTNRKNGLLAELSKRYNIKPGSKESAAAQMYAEGFYVDDNNDIIAYGDAELAKDFPDAQVQRNIKGLATDQRIRQFYDDTLAMINESRARNAYPEIPRLDNYFLHFRAMDDTFSKLGLPFNPNDIRAKDLPTDLNGVTADLKPGQPYFASAMHRKGKRTSFDLLGGLERYASSAKNQIYHIDDIQNFRALRNYLADNLGQAHGLENIDTMTEEEAQQRIEEVFNSHLSTFAKFLNEEANVLAGKTALIDRGIEGIIGRRGITFLDTLNKQVGSNMVGYNVSSSLTNFDALFRGFAKSNKYDFLKAFTQYTSNKIGSAFGKGDGFAENNPTIIRRNGADRFARTPWQKVGDAGYALMGVVDNISTEILVRAKYNELTRNGMSEQQAVVETDKWISRLMGDRSLGQQPLLFNSKMLGLVTKFQLEVRNNLDSMFYDTIQDAKVSNEEIVNAKERNAKTAAKITSTLVQTAVATHLFGKAFEAIAGYNPTFDIVSVLATLFGFDDEEESEDTALDNVEQAFLELLEDLPYTSTFTGGRIPIGSALPIEQLLTGKDQYGNEKSRVETIAEAAPYYLLPGGYGQIKKTTQGLGMFSDDLPIAGSYTDSGNLRYPVEDTLLNRLQAGVFGQYASANARDYFDNNRTALKEKQIQEFIDVDIPIRDYWEYREGLSEQKTIEDKFDYIAGLDLPVAKKNILINNIVDRKEDVDLEGYEDFSNYEEFDFATKNPEKYTVAKAVGGYNSYATYYKEMNDISADKDENGKSITGSRKEKIIDYVNNLDIDYGMKIILFKSEYKADDTYNADILDYLNSRDDLTYEEIVTILTELDFTVDAQGNVYWN